jgi:uncharacterized protein YjiS (DUF1127 family)
MTKEEATALIERRRFMMRIMRTVSIVSVLYIMQVRSDPCFVQSPPPPPIAPDALFCDMQFACVDSGPARRRTTPARIRRRVRAQRRKAGLLVDSAADEASGATDAARAAQAAGSSAAGGA